MTTITLDEAIRARDVAPKLLRALRDVADAADAYDTTAVGDQRGRNAKLTRLVREAKVARKLLVELDLRGRSEW
jgi:hypothetical protein